MILNSNNNNNNQGFNAEEVHEDDLIYSVKLVDYLKNNKNIEPYNKIIIIKNIASAFQNYIDSCLLYGELNMHDFMINQDKLSIQIVKNDSQAYLPNNVEDLLYSSPEKLNTLAITAKSDVYSITAIIIDTITQTTPLYAFEKKIWIDYASRRAKSDSQIRQQSQFSVADLKEQAQRQFFGKDEIDEAARQTVGYYVEKGIEICAASFERIDNLKAIVSQFKYLSEKSKQSFINLFLKGLSVKDNLRPTQHELVNMLKTIVNEFSNDYINAIYMEIVKLINTRKNQIEEKFPNLVERDEYTSKVNALYTLLRQLTSKENITNKQVNGLKEFIDKTFELIEKDEKIDAYLNNINKKILPLEEKINKSVNEEKEKRIGYAEVPMVELSGNGEKISSQLNVHDMQDVPQLIRKNCETYAKSLNFFSFNKVNHELFDKLKKTYHGPNFFAHEVKKIEKAIAKNEYISLSK